MNVFVDANIFIRIATQGRPGCEREHLDDLRTLVEESTFVLLVPEVVYLEVSKAFRTLPQEMESNCDKLSDAINKATKDTWSEIDSLKTDVLALIKQLKQKRIAECAELMKLIDKFLKSTNVTLIPLTPEIVVAAKRRQIAGKMPHCKKSSDQDALIVESLVSHFERQNINGPLLFCTENTKDFALEVNQKELDRRFILYPDIQESLPKSHFSTTLASLLSVATGFEHLPDPTNAEIEEALANRDLHDDIDDELFGEAHQLLMEAVNKEYVRQFREDVLPSLPNEVQLLRNRLADDIRQILLLCRNCRSWGERSEYKLPQWIEHVDEEMIPYTSLPKMVRIKKSLEEYLEVHRRMDNQESAEESVR